MTGATHELAEWAASLRFEDIPPRVVERTKLQVLSVLGAIGAGRHSEAARAALEAARSWGGAEEATVFSTGERLGRLGALFANGCASVAFDFDDYLFAGHTGHSAVCTSLAYGELVGASGRDVLVAAVAANEVGGRLGAALLFGPHNGQMWAYIHLLEAACVAGRLLGLDPGRMADAIGIAFAQPCYPLLPAFMGPDSKLLIAASPSVEGARAAELASRGWTGSRTILEDPQGFLARFNRDHLGWMLTGLGEAWVSDSLSYKVVPGCAYIDTAVDALTEIVARRGGLEAGEVASVEVRCGMFTAGMEGFAQAYRRPDRLTPVSVNFSVALSFGLMLEAGRLAPEYLSQAYLDAHREEIEAVASRVTLRHDIEMDLRAAAAAEAGGFSLRALMAGAPAEVRQAVGATEATPPPRGLSGISFEGYRMAFPAEVTVRTASGEELVASQDVPLGAAGRPWEETRAAVRKKFARNAVAPEAEGLVASLEELGDVRELTRRWTVAAGAGRR